MLDIGAEDQHLPVSFDPVPIRATRMIMPVGGHLGDGVVDASEIFAGFIAMQELKGGTHAIELDREILRLHLHLKNFPEVANGPALAQSEPWRFLTAAFLHSPGQYLHIVFNMVALWFVGPTLENTLGRARYITLYLMSAIGGSVGSVLLATATDSWATTSVGASGAVFGLFGAILVISKRLGGDVRGILVLIGINLALGFVMANIAWQAHVGGLVTGGLLAAAYAYAPPARRKLVAVAAPVALGAVLLVATLLTYASIGAFSL